jgi:hypothetical protein
MIVAVLPERQTTMKFMVMTTVLALVLVAGVVTLRLSLGAASVSASSARKGDLHVTKDCLGYTGAAGSFCTITSSNLPAIVIGSKVFYFQAPVASTRLLDSNIVLDAGNGNRAVGRCTLDLVTNLALCTFSNGTGEFTGFHARVDGSGSFANYHWDGTCNFSPGLGGQHGDN